VRFHEATELTQALIDAVQAKVRQRVLKVCVRLEPDEAEDMLGWQHNGGFSIDASVRIETCGRAASDRWRGSAIAAQRTSSSLEPLALLPRGRCPTTVPHPRHAPLPRRTNIAPTPARTAYVPSRTAGHLR
jgi:hypothetical protein